MLVSQLKSSSSLVPWSGTQNADIALVCVPWAGAGATPFRAWAQAVRSAAVYGVRLPGRENRRMEPAPTLLADVVDTLVADVAALDARRVVLFGHCSGALVAFETARALQRSEAGPRLAHLLVASQLPPMDVADEPGTIQDAGEYVPEELHEEPDMVELLLPIISADMALVAGYTYRSEPSIATPLTVFYGAHDGRVRRPAVEGWAHVTTGPTEAREIAGADHLFGGAAWLTLGEAVGTTIDKL